MWSLNATLASIQSSWTGRDGVLQPDNSIIDSAASIVLDYITAGHVRVNRLALVTSHFVPEPAPVDLIARMFFSEQAISEVDETTGDLEVHKHTIIPELAAQQSVNHRVRIKCAMIITTSTKGILVEQDINTVEDPEFLCVKQTQRFFAEANARILETLNSAFPE